MANTIIHKRSSVAAKIPLSADLALGELAINTTDGKVFMKKGNGTVIEVGLDKTSIDGDLIPDIDNTRSLGSASKMWKDIFVGPGSLYVNGQKVIEDNSGTIVVGADQDENIQIKTLGTGDVELLPSGTGVVQVKGTISILAGKNLTSSDSNPISVAVGLNMNNESITSLLDPVNNQDATTKSWVLANSANLDSFNGGVGVNYNSSTGNIEIGQDVGTTSNVTFNDVTVNGTLNSDDITATTVNIAGNLTVSGTTTTVNSTTVDIADLNITVASNASNSSQANGAGLTIGGANATITYNSAFDGFELSKQARIPNLETLKYTKSYGIPGTDLNALTTSGFYDGNNLTNSPDGGNGWFYIRVQRHQNNNGYVWQEASDLDSDPGNMYTRFQQSGTWSSWMKVWTSGNDGAGSGLDADTIHGLQIDESASNNTIVKRTSSGYVYANYFHTDATTQSSGVTKVFGETGNDGFIRRVDQAGLNEFIGKPSIFALNTTNTSSNNANKYTKIMRIQVSSQYSEWEGIFKGYLSNHALDTTDAFDLNIRVKQQATFGSNPLVSVDYSSIYDAHVNFGYKIVQNSGPTIVDVYAFINNTYTTVTLQEILSNTGISSSSVQYYSSQSFSTIPSGYVAGYEYISAAMDRTNTGNFSATGTITAPTFSGTATNANTLQGAAPSESSSNSTIVKRTSNSYVYANYFHTDATTQSSGVTKVFGETGNDGFIRKVDAAGLRTFLGNITLTGDVSGSGTNSINVTVNDDSHNHIISNVDGLQSSLDAKAPLSSPAFTNVPTAPTAANGTNTNQIATTAFVQANSGGGTVNTASVLNATAGLTAGQVGSYAFVRTTDQSNNVSPGDTVPGSSIKYSGIHYLNNSQIMIIGVGPDLTGTWRILGITPIGAQDVGATLAIRIL